MKTQQKSINLTRHLWGRIQAYFEREGVRPNLSSLIERAVLPILEESEARADAKQHKEGTQG